ncbi:MAG: GNAT family N-acetyltransferase [Planctomycetaceae bacterium]
MMISTCLEPGNAAPSQRGESDGECPASGRFPHTLGGADETVVPLDGDIWVEHRPLAETSTELNADWDDLAAQAASPNVFYERWNLRAAQQHIAPTASVELVLIYRRSRKPGGAPRLCGLFPLLKERCSKLPLMSWRLFEYAHGYLQTPLIRSGQERPVLEAFLDWASSLSSGPGLLDWSLIDGDGPIAHALADLVAERRLVTMTLDIHSRAVLRRKANWEQAAATSLSSHHRRELRRQHRRLNDMGDLTVRSLNTDEDLSAWQQAFLRLEQSGWKGDSGTAIAEEGRDRSYFLQMSTSAHKARQLRMIGLFLNGEPIAMRTSLLSGGGSFAWKIAYDEKFSKFSPGVQLEIENVRDMHEETQLDWMDSCARAEHFMINRVWSDRRMIQHVLISLGGRVANLAIGSLPLARAIKRSLRPNRN